MVDDRFTEVWVATKTKSVPGAPGVWTKALSGGALRARLVADYAGGEEWSLTGDDERLTEVLKKFLAKLGADAELAGTKPVLREDGSDAIPDLVLGRRLESRQNYFQHLVVELKRPRHRLDDEDVLQIRGYASAITNDERFDQPNTSWEF